jgi:hypothetical protein
VQIIEILNPIILSTAYIIAAFLIAKHIFVSYFFILHKNKITKLSSQISNLKLKLKTRLVHKFNNVANFGNDEITAVILPLIVEIKELEFRKPEDYQLLIAKMIEIIEKIKREEQLLSIKPILEESEVNSSIAPELDLLRTTYSDLFEFDKGIMAIIIEIYLLHSIYVSALRQYNKYAALEKNKKLSEEVPEPILIENFYLLEDIYNKYKKDLNPQSQSDSDAKGKDKEDNQNKKAS